MSRAPAAYLLFQHVLRHESADLHLQPRVIPLLPQPCSA